MSIETQSLKYIEIIENIEKKTQNLSSFANL